MKNLGKKSRFAVPLSKHSYPYFDISLSGGRQFCDNFLWPLSGVWVKFGKRSAASFPGQFYFLVPVQLFGHLTTISVRHIYGSEFQFASIVELERRNNPDL
jgi:hypothetical protein